MTDGTWTGRAGSLYESTVLFAGYWRDTETGLYHVRHRMYHVRLGLWLIRDPEGYVDGMSLYQYVQSGPLNATDPQGLEGWFNEDFKEGFEQNYDEALDKAAREWNKGGVKGFLGFLNHVVEACTHRFTGGLVSGLDYPAMQDYVEAESAAEIQRIGESNVDASSGRMAVQGVAVGAGKNLPLVGGGWRIVESLYGEKLGGLNHGDRFGNLGDRIGHGSLGVSDVAASTAGILKLTGVNPKLGAGSKAARTGVTPKRGMNNPKVRDAAACGRQAHGQFAETVNNKPGWQSEPTIRGRGGEILRPDALDPKGRPVELKPNTPSGRGARSVRQIQKYKDATGTNGRVIYYEP